MADKKEEGHSGWDVLLLLKDQGETPGPEVQRVSAIRIEMLTEQIYGLEQLLGVDEGADKDKRTENAPAQESACAEAIVDASASQLVADSVGQIVDPDNENDTQSKTGEDEDNKAVVQGLLAIISADNGVALDSGSLSDLGMILYSRTAGK